MVVIFHLVKHVYETVEIKPFNETQLFSIRQFLQKVSQTIVVHNLGQLFALLQRKSTHYRGHIGWVHVVQTSRFSLHLGTGSKQGADFVPIN